MTRTKLVGAAGRFGVRYGQLVKRRIATIEKRQRKNQACPFCNGRAIRESKGIWNCKKCGKTFAGHAYFLEKFYKREEPKQKVLKEENTTKTEIKTTKSKKSNK
jgi:large subunit ribosomal protein L37Ae